MNTVERLKNLADQKMKQNQISEEEARELKKACNHVFSTEEGKLIAKYMKKECGIVSPPDLNLNPSSLIFEKGKIHMYKTFVLGLIDRELGQEIERN